MQDLQLCLCLYDSMSMHLCSCSCVCMCVSVCLGVLIFNSMKELFVPITPEKLKTKTYCAQSTLGHATALMCTSPIPSCNPSVLHSLPDHAEELHVSKALI